MIYLLLYSLYHVRRKTVLFSIAYPEEIEIDMETAPIVLEIFERVIAGDTFGVISRDLNIRGIPDVLGGKWCVQRIRDIVRNEKYTGNAMLQKHFRNNHLEKKKCRN